MKFEIVLYTSRNNDGEMKTISSFSYTFDASIETYKRLSERQNGNRNDRHKNS